MTPATQKRYESSCEKLAMVSMGLKIGSYEPIDLFQQSGVHCLFLEGFRNLTAVVAEGTGTQVQWTSK